MTKKCPNCGSSDVRRSHFQGTDEYEHHLLRSPYRCQACGVRFFAISRKTRQAAIGVLAIAVFVVAVFTAWRIREMLPASEPPPPRGFEGGAGVLAALGVAQPLRNVDVTLNRGFVRR